MRQGQRFVEHPEQAEINLQQSVCTCLQYVFFWNCFLMRLIRPCRILEIRCTIQKMLTISNSSNYWRLTATHQLIWAGRWLRSSFLQHDCDDPVCLRHKLWTIAVLYPLYDMLKLNSVTLLKSVRLNIFILHRNMLNSINCLYVC